MQLTRNRLSSDLASRCSFLNDIIARVLVILSELCSQVIKTRQRDSEELQSEKRRARRFEFPNF